MVTATDTNEIRQLALDHLWMHNADWVTMAEEGGPSIMVSGDGVRVTDGEGNVWIDAHGGYASVNAGYGQTAIADAMLEQMRKLTYFPQGTTTVPLIRLVEKLGELAPDNLERVWPVSGGSEANETAVKIARAYHKRRGDSGRYKVISRRGSYHGATGGVMWMGASSGLSDFEPAMPGMLYAPQPNFYRCEFDSDTPEECAERAAKAVEELILLHSPDTVAAFIGEPIASGLSAPAPEYWQMVREICDRYGVILIADEVVTGFGRTGRMFAMEHFGVVPDIMTVAKGITSSYLPLAATIAGTHIADAFAGEDNIFRQALTFGGHPRNRRCRPEEHRDYRAGRPCGQLGAHGRVLLGAAARVEGKASVNRRCARHRAAARLGTGSRPRKQGRPSTKACKSASGSRRRCARAA